MAFTYDLETQQGSCGFEVHVRAKFYQIMSSSLWVLLVTEKKKQISTRCQK